MASSTEVYVVAGPLIEINNVLHCNYNIQAFVNNTLIGPTKYSFVNQNKMNMINYYKKQDSDNNFNNINYKSLRLENEDLNSALDKCKQSDLAVQTVLVFEPGTKSIDVKFTVDLKIFDRTSSMDYVVLCTDNTYFTIKRKILVENIHEIPRFVNDMEKLIPFRFEVLEMALNFLDNTELSSLHLKSYCEELYAFGKRVCIYIFNVFY